MRSYTDIAVDRAVVHVVAPKTGILQKSSAEIEIDDAVEKFLVDHVAHGLADGQARAGAFKVVGPNRTEGLCRQIVAATASVVAPSAQLAQNLYDASLKPGGTDARVSDGTLVVVRCTATEDQQTTIPFVALLKLDPNDTWRADALEDETGAAVVRLRRQPNTLPGPRERVQKAAFVRAKGSDYDLLVVDRQRPGEIVSEFFIDGFLGAEHVFDSRQRTEALYVTLRRTSEEVGPELDTKTYKRLDQYIEGVVVGATANLDTIVDGLPVTESVKQRFEETLREALPDREFDTDTGFAEKLIKRRTFRGDNGLSLSIPSRFFGTMVKTVPPASSGGYWTITIKTKAWTER
jgi:hypothetical protein